MGKEDKPAQTGTFGKVNVHKWMAGQLRLGAVSKATRLNKTKDKNHKKAIFLVVIDIQTSGGNSNANRGGDACRSSYVQIPDYLQKKTRVARSFHPKRFINLGSKSNAYKYSFFVKTVKEWNGLPDELIEQETLESFKSALANYLNHWPFFVFFVSLLFDRFTLALVTAPFKLFVF